MYSNIQNNSVYSTELLIDAPAGVSVDEDARFNLDLVRPV